MLAGDFDIKLVCAASYQRVDGAHHFGKMHRCSSRVSGASLAVKVQKINAFAQGLGALPFDVFANVVLAGV